jgi:hypothetical protein
MIYNKASDVVNAKSDVNFIMVHGIKDEEVRIGSTALISRDFANTNVRKIIAYNEGVNTHMGVIRNDKGSKPDVNQKILDEIISTLGRIGAKKGTCLTLSDKDQKWLGLQDTFKF